MIRIALIPILLLLLGGSVIVYSMQSEPVPTGYTPKVDGPVSPEPTRASLTTRSAVSPEEKAITAAEAGVPLGVIEEAPDEPGAEVTVVLPVAIDPEIAKRFGLGHQEIRGNLLEKTSIWQGKSLETIADVIRYVPDLSSDQLDRVVAFFEENERDFSRAISQWIVLEASRKGGHAVVDVSSGAVWKSSPSEHPNVEQDFFDLRRLYDDFFASLLDPNQLEAFQGLHDRWGWK